MRQRHGTILLSLLLLGGCGSDAVTPEVVTGRIAVVYDSLSYWLSSSETATDSFLVSPFGTGPVGHLAAEMEGAAPWASVSLHTGTEDFVSLQITPAATVQGQHRETLRITSDQEGMVPAEVLVTLNHEATPLASRSWSPICVDTDSLADLPISERACASVHAKVFERGSGRTLAVDIVNHQGSSDPNWDTSSRVDITMFGFLFPEEEPALDAQLTSLGPNGKAFVQGSPFPEVRSGAGTSLRWLDIRAFLSGAVVGCRAGPAAGGWIQTCGANGQNGSVRFNFDIAATNWSLDELGLYLSLSFAAGGGRICTVGEAGCRVRPDVSVR